MSINLQHLSYAMLLILDKSIQYQMPVILVCKKSIVFKEKYRLFALMYQRFFHLIALVVSIHTYEDPN